MQAQALRTPHPKSHNHPCQVFTCMLKPVTVDDVEAAVCDGLARYSHPATGRGGERSGGSAGGRSASAGLPVVAWDLRLVMEYCEMVGGCRR